MAIATVPLKLAFGWKYNRVLALAAKSRAVVLVTAPRALHEAPLSTETNQLPLAVSAAVTAMPSSGAESTSVTLSTWPDGEAKSTRADTGVPTAPTGGPASSFSAVRTGNFDASSTGASLTALTVMETVAAAESIVPSLTVNLKLSEPL